MSGLDGNVHKLAVFSLPPETRSSSSSIIDTSSGSNNDNDGAIYQASNLTLANSQNASRISESCGSRGIQHPEKYEQNFDVSSEGPFVWMFTINVEILLDFFR